MDAVLLYVLPHGGFFMHAKPLSEDLFRLLSVPARVQDGARAAAVRISGDG
jgi:hypothetical protein